MNGKLEEDIRWKQRFQNFEKAFLFLKKAVATIRDSYFSALKQVYETLKNAS